MDSNSLLDALKADKVLSVAQLERHHGVSEEEARALGARAFSLVVGKTQGRLKQDPYRFVMQKGKRAPKNGATVRHITGAAEIRHLLGAAHDSWISDAGPRRAKNKPDAIWTTPAGVIAIEYDAGSYSPTKITNKIMSFSHSYAKQIWGTPVKSRVAGIKYIARNLVPDLEVYYAPWF